jgi:hypothetical protein
MRAFPPRESGGFVLLLQFGYLAQNLIAIWDELDVDVDGRISPAIENCGCSTGEIDPTRLRQRRGQLAHEQLDVTGVG